MLNDKPDIYDVVSKFVRLEKENSKEYKGLCPLHDEKTPSFKINIEKQVFYCHACLEENELIWTENGLLAIGELKKNNKVFTSNSNLKQIKNITRKQSNVIIEVELS